MPPHVALRYLQAKVHPRDYATLSDRLKTAALKEVADSYSANVRRLHNLIDLPTYVTYFTRLAEHHTDKAKLAVFNTLDPVDPTVEQLKEWRIRLQESVAEWERNTDVNTRARLLITQGQGGLASVLLNGGAELQQGFEAILIAQITGTWTLFESVTGDLWETALNIHPKRLAALCGKSDRIRKISKHTTIAKPTENEKAEYTPPNLSEGGADRPGDKLVSLAAIHKLTGGKCDLSNIMGTLIRGSERFSFSNPHGIREAYSASFDKHSNSIDAILADRCIDALCVVRNVFVHRGGRADEKYHRDAQGTSAPPCEVGSLIPVNGKLVGELVGPVMGLGMKLIEAVDEWLDKHAEKKA